MNAEFESEIACLAHQANLRAIYAAEDTERERSRPFYLLRPRVFPDGNQWCALYGANLQEGVAGFGDTPAKASVDFDIQWLNAKLQVPSKDATIAQPQYREPTLEDAWDLANDKGRYFCMGDIADRLKQLGFVRKVQP